MMRCKFCGRTLTDPQSQKDGRGPECAKKTETLRSRRIDALTAIVEGHGPDADYAAHILRRMDAQQDLSVRMKRFRDQVAGGLLPKPGDLDFVCHCATPDGSHPAHCLRGQRARAATLCGSNDPRVRHLPAEA